MIFHENCLLADNSHEISFLIFFRKLGKMSENLSCAAIVIGALRANIFENHTYQKSILFNVVFLMVFHIKNQKGQNVVFFISLIAICNF